MNQLTEAQKEIRSILSDFSYNIENWKGHASTFNSTSEYYDIAMKKIEQLIAEAREQGVRELLDNLMSDVKNGIEYNYHHNLNPDITKEQVFSYIAYWREKLQADGGKEGKDHE